VNIWALIDITDMDRNDVLLLNDKFAEFWINEMTREEKKKDIRFTFVIQVDEMITCRKLFMKAGESLWISTEAGCLYYMYANTIS
jgi:adenine C2-methylase RlmN of 23S rRNA A2503 and tRNA A37